MKDLMEDIFGTYSPTGSEFAQADWSYILGVLLFIVFIVGLFKLLNVIIGGK